MQSKSGVADLVFFFKDCRIFFLSIPLASSLTNTTTKIILEVHVNRAGNFVAMMVVGHSTMRMNLNQRQEIDNLGCQMTLFNCFPLSMNRFVRECTGRLPSCQNIAVLAKKTEKTDRESVFFFFSHLQPRGEQKVMEKILHEWRRKKRVQEESTQRRTNFRW